MTTQAEALAAIPVSDLTPEQLSAIVAEMCGWRSKVYTMADGSTRIEWDAPKGSGGRIGLPMPPAYATDDGLAIHALEAWCSLAGEIRRYAITTTNGWAHTVRLEHCAPGSADQLPVVARESDESFALAACLALVAARRVG